MSSRRYLLPLALLQLLGACTADAQVFQGGYDLGPDFGAMIEQQLQQGNQLAAQMREQEQQIVQQLMQNPDCVARYQQHVAAGGGLSFPQFAYQYAATAGFSNDGIARFRDNERRNLEGERRAWAGYRGAQDQRAITQNGYAEGYFANQVEAGNVLQGNSSWIDPASGQNRALAYSGQNTIVDPATGQTFYRDDSGQYYALGSDGLWYPMTPGR